MGPCLTIDRLVANRQTNHNYGDHLHQQDMT